MSLYFDENEENLPFNPELVMQIERIHTNNPNANARSFKLLGILLDENLNFNANT